MQEKLDKFTIYLGGRLDLCESTKQVYLATAEQIFDDTDFTNNLTGTVRNHLKRAGITIDERAEVARKDWLSDLTPEQRIYYLATEEIIKRIPDLDLAELMALAGLEE